VLRDDGTMRKQIEQAHDGHPSSFATLWKPITNGGGR
jgi:hypothetical protein